MKNWNQYLNQEIHCGCGTTHFCGIEEILLEEQAIRKLPYLLSKHSYQTICIVSDIHTEKAAGSIVKEVLTAAGYSFHSVLLEAEEPLADEKTAGMLLIELPIACDLILAVGAGTINDLCRLLSSKTGIPYYSIATAASMDGYASNVAPLIVKNMKTTYEAVRPRVIIGDLDVLCQAPLSMTAAGVGDILGKFVCLTDWKLSQLVTGEYYCDYAASLIRESVEAVTNAVDGAAKGEKAAIAAVMEGLILSGIAMSYIGNSRPASGSEHHLSHYWEMMSLMQGSHGALHGTKVGIGTVLTLSLYHKLPVLLSLQNREEPNPDFDFTAWSQSITEAYQEVAPQIIRLEHQVHKNAPEHVMERRQQIKAHKQAITELIESLPSADEIAALLKQLNAPYLPSEIGVTPSVLKNSILYAKDLRNRYGLLQILFDLGLSEQIAARASESHKIC